MFKDSGMIIDCHCHAGRGDIMTAPWNTVANLRPYLRRARAAGISKTVVFPVFHSDYEVANRELASIVRRAQGKLIGFASVNPRKDRGRIMRLISTAVHEYGFCGLKVHGHIAYATREVCDAAKAFGIPLLYDVAGRMEAIDMVAEQYPDVNFIIPHMGSFADDWRAQQRMVEQLQRYSNVYADTSGVRRFDYLVEALRRAGSRKLLFGSDGPWLHPGVELAKIKALGLRSADMALITGGNVRRLIVRRTKSPS
jgi:predicted TIM-barrel fold metal-dependent hydrolase